MSQLMIYLMINNIKKNIKTKDTLLSPQNKFRQSSWQNEISTFKVSCISTKEMQIETSEPMTQTKKPFWAA